MSNALSPLNTRCIALNETRELRSYLTPDEVHRLLVACEERKRDHLLINLAWQTGCRISELINLKIGDLDFYNCQVAVRTLKKRGKRSKQAHRWVPVHPELIAETSAYVLAQRIQDRIFPISRQRAFQIVKQASVRAGLPKKTHPHTLRHSFAVNCLSQGVPITVLKDLLGHESVLTTMVYLKIVRQEAKTFLSQVRF